jgi:hypothetical protein
VSKKSSILYALLTSFKETAKAGCAFFMNTFPSPSAECVPLIRWLQ